jgi:hypothetical protein
MLILEIMALLKIKEVENLHFLLQHVGGIVLYLKNQKKKKKKEREHFLFKIPRHLIIQ